MLFYKFDQLMNAIENVADHTHIFSTSAYPIEFIAIDRMSKNVDGLMREFVTLRDIKIAVMARGNGIFTAILNSLEASGTHVMVDDIVNDELYNFLIKNGYSPYAYSGNDGYTIRCAYKLKENIKRD